MSKLKVFVSYAHEDAEYKNELLKHCSLLVDDNEIEIWTDDKIRAGDKFDDEINDRIESSDMFILLLSSAYWTKEYIKDTELPLILKHEETRDISIVPILLNGFNKIKRTKLKDRTLIPSIKNTLTPIDDFDISRQAWEIVYDEIENSIESHHNKKKENILAIGNIVQQEKITKVGIYIASPLNANLNYKIEEIIKPFKRFKLELYIKTLNEENIDEHYEYDYNFIFTNINKDRLIIEDEYFYQKSLSVEYFKGIKNLFLFLDKELENNYNFNITVFNLSSLRKILNFLFKSQKGNSLFKKYYTDLPTLIDRTKLNNFVGRETELEAIIRKILNIKKENKVFTIKGSGGLGKTTIVSKAVDEISKRHLFKDGIKFVSCEKILNYKGFENEMTIAFDMNNATEFQEQLEKINLEEERLIILDNLETVLNNDESYIIKELIKFISKYATIIITSREILNDNNLEEIYELKSFSTDESELLFKKIYNKLNIKNKKDNNKLREIVLEKFLNNNAFAITLVANNLSTGKDIDAIVKELEENFDEVTQDKELMDIFNKEADSNIERKMSLYHSVNYSYKKLKDKERLALEIISLFPDGIHFTYLHNFYNQKFTGKDKNKETIKHKLENFSDLEIKSLENKSLIINRNQYINLQSIIGRFAEHNFKKRTELEKTDYYMKAFLYNDYIDNVLNKMKDNSKIAQVFDNLKNNFLKSLEYLNYIEYDKNQIIYLNSITYYFIENSFNENFFRKLNNLREKFNQNKDAKELFEIIYLTYKYFCGEFDYVVNILKTDYSIELVNKKYSTSNRIHRSTLNHIHNIYGMEGYALDEFKYFLNNSDFYFSSGFQLGEFNIIDKMTNSKDYRKKNDFFLFEYKLNNNNNNNVDVKKLEYYIKSLHKSQLLEIVQSSYTLIKRDKSKIKIKNIKKLVIFNPFTKGLKTLMLGIKSNNEEAKSLYIEAIEKLYHIKYYHVEAIYLYSKHLQEIQDDEYKEWYTKGKELAQKHYYRYLLHQFICLDSGVYTDYNEDNYPLPEPLDYSKIIKKYNLKGLS